MREFFHGWRRKMGCVALVMACLISSVWARSHHIADEIRVTVAGREHVVASMVGRFMWRSNDKSKTTNRESYWMLHDVEDLGLTAESLEPLLAIPPELRHLHARQWVISYWPVATTLTLLSAYLFLGKARSKVERDA